MQNYAQTVSSWSFAKIRDYNYFLEVIYQNVIYHIITSFCRFIYFFRILDLFSWMKE